ncbi:MAG: DAHL domain-containing protein [Rhodocyclaceae bacterium]
MSTPTLRSRLAIAGLTVVLGAVLAFLFVRTQGYDESAYFENVARLRQIKQLDAHWELDALKSKIGINTHYDPLVDPLLDLQQLQAKLGELAAAQGSSVAALDQAILQKTGLVERFKTHNSVLRNSLAFLPGAVDDLRLAMGAAKTPPAAARQVAATANEVLLASLVFNQNGASEKAAEIEAALARLSVEKRQLPTGVGDSIDIFAAHVRTVLREHQSVNGLLNRIADVPVAARVDDIDRLLADRQLQAAAESQHYRRHLLAFSVLLTALLVYAAICLIRSHAVIKRVNLQLREANEGLEQRVRERTRELHTAQAELVATARQAGMAEIATNVLHNVGNVLNSVNVSTGVVSNQVRNSKAAGLSRAVQLLDAHAADLGTFLTHDEKGRHLPEYLKQLAAALAAEQTAIVEELGELSKSVEHIKDIVATQQSYAGASRLVEPVQIRDLVDDALRMNAGALMRHDVSVIKEYDEVPMLPLDRHRVLQILVNLINNAKQAMDATDRTHRMTLRVGMVDSIDVTDGASGRSLQICVADEGDGIGAENMTRIFNHGFTTRPNGHGFGLHSCVLAAREMGGTLTAQSDGPGLGAAFTLSLPVGAGAGA